MTGPLQAWLREFVSRPPFLSKYPYYAALLARLDPIPDPFVRVMAVSAHGFRFYLHVNLDFFTAQPQYLTGVLLHEIHHVVLGHLSHPKFQDAAHPDLMDVAMELSANEHIREPLPGKPVIWQDYAHGGVRAGQSTIERYDLLVRGRMSGQHVPAGDPLDEHLAWGVGGVGLAAPPRHPWLIARVHHLIEESIKDVAAKGQDVRGAAGLLAGQLPANLIESLAGCDDEPEQYMDWKAALQAFVGRFRTPVHTYARPNRRFPDRVGIVPGRIFFPNQAEQPALLVAIDTSGSMSPEELVEVARQLVLLSHLAELTIVECDAQIHRTYPFAGRLPDVVGRGGTDLRPVFAPDFLREHRPDGVVYFTDGLGPYPAEDPGVKTLWVLTKPHDFLCPWGQKAQMSAGAAP